jgi:hypothetical protein
MRHIEEARLIFTGEGDEDFENLRILIKELYWLFCGVALFISLIIIVFLLIAGVIKV